MIWNLMTKLTVKDGERALLTRNGRLERVLEPGRHRLFDPRNELTVEVLGVVRTEFSAERYAVLNAARPDLASELFELVETKANEIAIVSLDGRPVHLMTPWQVRVYWKVATRIDVERIDVASDPRVSARHLAMIERNRPTIVTEAVVENHEAGLLSVEGRLTERLAPGRHAFWVVGRKIEVKRLDLRPQAVEITAQEMLTKDRIALRVTLTALRRIVDPERVVATVPDVDAWLYRLVQFAMAGSAGPNQSARFLHDLEPVSLQSEHHGQSQMRAFLRLDPVGASPIRIVFLWITVKGRANGEFDHILRIIRHFPDLGR
jgi:regulator of protease activity HflC (stomatin/prohibitin superfamily)